MQSIPSCPITGLPATRRIQPISARLISGLWRGAFGVSTDRQLADIDQFGLWESPCGLAFFDPMLEGDEAFYLDLYRRGDFHRALSVPASPGLNSDASPNWFDRGIRFSTSAVAKAPWRRICRTLLVSDSTRIVMRTLPSSTSGAKRLQRMPHHIPKNTTPSAPFTPSSTWPTRWTLPAIW
jgi:hypothetical protein